MAKETNFYLFQRYQELSGAVLKAYYKDKKRKYKELTENKKKLVQRLEKGKSKYCLIQRFKSPLFAWETWEKSFLDYEQFISWENTETFRLYNDVLTYQPDKKTFTVRENLK